MIPKTVVIPTVMARLAKLPLGHGLDLRTYKRNRSVQIIRKTENLFTVTQNGFNQASFAVSTEKLPRLLTTLLKQEFPRSQSVRIYTVAEGGREIPRKI